MNITNTPWGTPEIQSTIGPGIILVSTARHGGLYLDENRWAELVKTLPEFRSFAGDYWLEEDCDFTVAVILWPDLFDPYCVRSSARYIQSGGARCCKNWLASAAGKKTREIAEKWEAEHFEDWMRFGGSSCDHGWLANLERVGDRKRIERIFPGYPERSVYTQAQLDAESFPFSPSPKPEPRRLAVHFNENDCGGVFDGVSTVTSDADPGL